MTNVAEKNPITLARKLTNLTQQELAEKTGFSRASIVNWETGKYSPTLKQLQAIATALEISLPELLGADKDPLIYEQNVKTLPLRRGRTIKVPVLSREFTACCGNGIGAFDITNDTEEMLEIPMNDLRIYDTMRPPFAVYADGNCLESLGIEPNDQIIINPAEEPSQGALCLVSMYDMNSVKWLFHLPHGKICLRSDNGDLELSREQQEEMNFDVIGVVVGIKKPRPKARVY